MHRRILLLTQLGTVLAAAALALDHYAVGGVDYAARKGQSDEDGQAYGVHHVHCYAGDHFIRHFGEDARIEGGHHRREDQVAGELSYSRLSCKSIDGPVAVRVVVIDHAGTLVIIQK